MTETVSYQLSEAAAATEVIGSIVFAGCHAAATDDVNSDDQQIKTSSVVR